jgi:hypothetical protein
MRPEQHDIIGQGKYIESLIEVVESMLDRETTPDERRQLQATAQRRISNLAEASREPIARVLSSGSAYTPPELAREWGVSPDKILGWIRSGELLATNVAASQGGRPRYRIDAEAIRSFQQRRSNHTPAPVRARPKRASPDVIQFF